MIRHGAHRSRPRHHDRATLRLEIEIPVRYRMGSPLGFEATLAAGPRPAVSGAWAMLTVLALVQRRLSARLWAALAAVPNPAAQSQLKTVFS